MCWDFKTLKLGIGTGAESERSAVRGSGSNTASFARMSESGCIEDEPGQLHADFANQFISGGVLESSKCLLSKWLCPQPMRHNESILILGSLQLFSSVPQYECFGEMDRCDWC